MKIKDKIFQKQIEINKKLKELKVKWGSMNVTDFIKRINLKKENNIKLNKEEEQILYILEKRGIVKKEK